MCGKATGEKFQFRFLPNGIVETLTYRSFVRYPTTRLHGTRGSRTKEQVILNSSKISTKTMNFHRSQVSWMGELGTDAILQVYRRMMHFTQTLLKTVSEERQDLGK